MHLKTHQQLHSLLNFASEVQSRINKSSFEDVPLKECIKYLKLFPLTLTSPSASQRKSLDKQGTTLWNLCRNASSEENEAAARCRCHVRTLAFCMVEAAQSDDKTKDTDTFRILGVAQRAAKDCLAHNELELASKILQRVADYQQLSKGDDGGDTCEHAHITVTYLTYRITLAWKQARLDLANHFFSQLKTECVKRGVQAAEALIDLLLEMGRTLFEKKQYDDAMTWLSRGYEILQHMDPGLMSPDAGELRLCLMHTYVRVLLTKDDPEAETMALEVFAILERDYAGKLSVQLLNLQLLSRDKVSNGDKFFASLMTIIRSMNMTEINVQMIMHQFHLLKSLSPSLAFRALSQALTQRLASTAFDTWIEKSIITLIWIATTLQDESGVKASLDATFTEAHRIWKKTLSPEATQRALILLWKVIDKHFSQESYDAAAEWCKLAGHRIFSNAGETNMGKIERRLVLCYFHTSDIEAAKQLYDQMPDARKRSSLTRYLMFKVAVIGDDNQLAMQLFESFCHSERNDDQYLAACVSETLKAGKKHHACQILLRLLEKQKFLLPRSANTLVLFRCTIRLLVSDLESEFAAARIEPLCKVFESAAHEASVQKQHLATNSENSGASFTLDEAEWFAKTCYNVIVKYCTSWSVTHVRRLWLTFEEFRLFYCTHRLENEKAVSPTALVLETLSFNVDFVLAVLHVAEARKESDPTDKIHRYTISKDHFERIHARFPSANANSVFDFSKYHAILPLDFERAVFEQEYSHLEFLIAQASNYEAAFSVYATFADCILSSVDSADVRPAIAIKIAVHLLCQIITIVRDNTSYNINQASRWTRCLIQLIFASRDLSQNNELFATIDNLTAQAVILARDSITAYQESLVLPSPGVLVSSANSSTKEGTLYPSEELEWLATTLFNKAVDYYVEGNDAIARDWADRAVELADILGEMPDATGHGEGGFQRALGKLLRERVKGLGW